MTVWKLVLHSAKSMVFAMGGWLVELMVATKDDSKVIERAY
jgi:hypothetical protein